jgi:hypothetical protein
MAARLEQRGTGDKARKSTTAIAARIGSASDIRYRGLIQEATMTRISFLPLIGVLALSAACEAKFGTDDSGNGVVGEVSAEGKAGDNMVSIKAPGVDIKVNIPESVRGDINSGGDTLYPGAQVGGMHIEAGGRGPDNGAVEIRFTSGDSPDKVAAWYRDPARKHFKIDSETGEGAGFVFNGHETDGNSRFKVRLNPRNGGGTDATLSVQESS